MVAYLDQVSAGQLPVNQEVLGKMQRLISLVPECGFGWVDEDCISKKPENTSGMIVDDMVVVAAPRADAKKDVVKGFAVGMNDSMMVMYASSLVRSVIALHNLINNKLENRDAELEEAKKKEPEKKEERTENIKKEEKASAK